MIFSIKNNYFRISGTKCKFCNQVLPKKAHRCRTSDFELLFMDDCINILLSQQFGDKVLRFSILENQINYCCQVQDDCIPTNFLIYHDWRKSIHIETLNILNSSSTIEELFSTINTLFLFS